MLVGSVASAQAIAEHWHPGRTLTAHFDFISCSPCSASTSLSLADTSSFAVTSRDLLKLFFFFTFYKGGGGVTSKHNYI